MLNAATPSLFSEIKRNFTQRMILKFEFRPCIPQGAFLVRTKEWVVGYY